MLPKLFFAEIAQEGRETNGAEMCSSFTAERAPERKENPNGDET
jgi:hypothetical protein